MRLDQLNRHHHTKIKKPLKNKNEKFHFIVKNIFDTMNVRHA